MRLLLAFLLMAVAFASDKWSSADQWVEDTMLVDVSGCGERAPGKYLTNPKSTSCPVCDMDCDKEGQLAEGLIQESDAYFTSFVEAGHGKVIVYGRKACGMTARFMSKLDDASITYTFMSIDTNEGRNEMWPKLQNSGIDLSRGIGLPAVDVYGTMVIRPSLSAVQDAAPEGGGDEPAGGDDAFNKLDADGDGMISREEWKNQGGIGKKRNGLFTPAPAPPAPPARAPAPPPSNSPGASPLILYGRERCGMCRAMKRKLKEAGMEYEMVSIDTKKGAGEMWPKLRAAQIGGRIGLPVMDMCGKMAIRPSIADIEAEC